MEISPLRKRQLNFWIRCAGPLLVLQAVIGISLLLIPGMQPLSHWTFGLAHGYAFFIAGVLLIGGARMFDPDFRRDIHALQRAAVVFVALVGTVVIAVVITWTDRYSLPQAAVLIALPFAAYPVHWAIYGTSAPQEADMNGNQTPA